MHRSGRREGSVNDNVDSDIFQRESIVKHRRQKVSRVETPAYQRTPSSQVTADFPALERKEKGAETVKIGFLRKMRVRHLNLSTDLRYLNRSALVFLRVLGRKTPTCRLFPVECRSCRIKTATLLLHVLKARSRILILCPKYYS